MKRQLVPNEDNVGFLHDWLKFTVLLHIIVLAATLLATLQCRNYAKQLIVHIDKKIKTLRSNLYGIKRNSCIIQPLQLYLGKNNTIRPSVRSSRNKTKSSKAGQTDRQIKRYIFQVLLRLSSHAVIVFLINYVPSGISYDFVQWIACRTYVIRDVTLEKRHLLP